MCILTRSSSCLAQGMTETQERVIFLVFYMITLPIQVYFIHTLPRPGVTNENTRHYKSLAKHLGCILWHLPDNFLLVMCYSSDGIHHHKEPKKSSTQQAMGWTPPPWLGFPWPVVHPWEEETPSSSLYCLGQQEGRTFWGHRFAPN